MLSIGIRKRHIEKKVKGNRKKKYTFELQTRAQMGFVSRDLQFPREGSEIRILRALSLLPVEQRGGCWYYGDTPETPKPNQGGR